MKLAGALVLVVAALATSAIVRAGDQAALVELNHQIIGPGWKTWSLRLEADGKVIEERYDWSSKKYHSTRTRCTLTKVDADRALADSRQMLASLPSTIDAGRPIPIDGPNKQMLVRQGADVRTSYWYSPEDAAPSFEAQAFSSAWDKIQALLTCGSKR